MMAFRKQLPLSLTPRFREALGYAYDLHADQIRKGSGVPYLSHLLAVTSLVMENGGDEDQAVAALLHDAVEDQGGRRTLEEIRRRFGERVALIVEGCTDAYTQPKPPWRRRKEVYLEHLRSAPAEVLLVSLADKVHNARSILADLRVGGESTWTRFNGGKAGSLWYYRSLAAIFSEVYAGPLAAELARTLAEIERLSGTEAGG
jgi:GTP pyrophosphokinase